MSIHPLPQNEDPISIVAANEPNNANETAIEIDSIHDKSDIPEGLEDLRNLSSIFIQAEDLHSVSKGPSIGGFDKRFFVQDVLGHQLYLVGERIKEHSCRSYRPFNLHVFDCSGDLVMEVERPASFKLTFWGADTAGNDLKVLHQATKQALGSVKQDFDYGGTSPSFQILDAQNSPVLFVKGEVEKGNCCDFSRKNYVDVDFSMSDARNNVITTELLIKDKLKIDGKPFGLQFPKDLDCAVKAVLLGLLLDIYITYYEDKPFSEGRQGCTGWRILMAISLVLLGIVFGVLVVILSMIIGPLTTKRPVNTTARKT